MANPVFESALATIRQAVSTVEAEVQHLASLEVRAKGVQQNIEALRTQQRDLEQANKSLALEVSASRQEVEDVKAWAKKLMTDAQQQKDRILAEGRQSASAIETRAHDAATGIVETAKKEAEPYAEKIAAAKRELETAKSQLDAIHAQVGKAENTLSAMKRNAAAWGTA